MVVLRPPLPGEELQAAGGEIDVQRAADGEGYELRLELGKGGAATARPSALFGHRGAPLDQLCPTEVEPIVSAVLNGESGAIIAYGMTGGWVGGWVGGWGGCARELLAPRPPPPHAPNHPNHAPPTPHMHPITPTTHPPPPHPCPCMQGLARVM